MCGLFGMVLPSTYPQLFHRGDAIGLLGQLAEERGRDAAGIAARFVTRTGSGAADENWRVTRARGPFHRLDHRRRLTAQLTAVSSVIGHTRWATQGSLSEANASPFATGSLLCTHNGDVDVATVPFRPAQVEFGGTDSAVLFAALSTAHRGPRVSIERLVTVLSKVHGRAALAWVDTARPGGRIWLARAGLSPLAVGTDIDGGLWWASNPQWLRILSREFDLPFLTMRLLAEGTLLSATPLARTVRMTEHATFKPVVRWRDQRLATHTVWRGFQFEDRAEGDARSHHRTLTNQTSHQVWR